MTDVHPTSHPHWRRHFAVLYAGQFASILSSQIAQMALMLYLSFTVQSAQALSLTALVAFLPQTMLGPVAGSLADRIPRKFILMAADAFVALSTIPLIACTLTGTLSFEVILLCSGLRSVGSAFHMPALMATIPQLVPDDHIKRIAGWRQMIASAGYILGSLVAGILYSFMPLWSLLATDIIGAILAILSVSLIPIPRLPHHVVEQTRAAGGIIKQNWHTLTILARHRGLLIICILSFVINIVFAPLSSVQPLFSAQHFGTDPTGVAIVDAAFSVGMIVGGLFIGMLAEKISSWKLLVVAVAVMGLSIALWVPLTPAAFWPYVALNVTLGLGCCAYNTPIFAVLQLHMPKEHHGRTFSLLNMSALLATNIGLVLSTFISDVIGLDALMLGMGVIITAMALCYLVSPSVRSVA